MPALRGALRGSARRRSSARLRQTLRILTLSNCQPVESLGSGYIVANYTRGLRQRGHEVDFFAPEDYEPLRRVALGTGYRKALGMLAVASRRLLAAKYDVVEFYGAESWLAVSMLSCLPRRRFLLVHHSNGLETHFLETIARHLPNRTMSGQTRRWYQRDNSRLFERSFTCVDALVTVSRFDANYALEHRYNRPDRVVAIENPLPDSFLGASVDYDRDRVLGFFGSWLELKGVALLATDTVQLMEEFDDLRLKLVGVGSSFRAADHFPEHVMDRIDVVPFVGDKGELARHYQDVSILVLPSVYESFGMVASEAMANGCAVVARRVGFAAGLEDGREAMLFDEPASPNLYRRVKELLVDDALRLRVARGGYDRVQVLRWDRSIDRLERRYRDWIAESAKLGADGRR